ncbi:MAG: hypothetical protein KGJ86_22350, partial [Chloroflexota bacterium]|nr:hypothetical protein [Chloroflexota bacterium]
GISGFKGKDDFLKAAKELTKNGSQWALAGTGSGYNSWNPIGWFMQIFRAPNDWRESGGKLTKDVETEEFKETVAYVRSLWDAGVMHPDSPSMNLTNAAAAWYSGKIILWQNSYGSFSIAWDRAVARDPDFKPGIITPFAHDGGKAVHLLGHSSDSLTAIKKSSPERVKELLGILDFMVAPFGTQENVLLNYGLKGRDFALNSKANPILNKQGHTEVTSFPIWRLSAPPPVIFNPNSTEFAQITHKATSEALAMGVPSPVAGLYSKTLAQKGATLNQKLTDGLNSIIYGRASVSSLDQLVKDWRTGGGDQVRSELEQALQTSAK